MLGILRRKIFLGQNLPHSTDSSHTKPQQIKPQPCAISCLPSCSELGFTSLQMSRAHLSRGEHVIQFLFPTFHITVLHAFLPPKQSLVYTKNFDKVKDTFNKGLSWDYKQKKESSLSLYFLNSNISFSNPSIT